MMRQAAIDYSKLIDINLDEKLKPIYHSVDDLLVRLEECEAMCALAQQERCNAIGLTGSLTQTLDHRQKFKDLCEKIDNMERLIYHIKCNIEMLESKMDLAEKEFGVTDNASKLKNFFAPVFKKTDSAESVDHSNSSVELFSTEDYFNTSQEMQN